MQFPYRIGALFLIVFFMFLINSLLRTNNSDEDQETKILRTLANLETHMTEYESGLRIMRSEMIIYREADEDKKDSKYSNGAIAPLSKKSRISLRSMNIYNALPHLMDNDDSLTPALSMNKNRDGINIVIGLPTVKRPTQSYLLPTLQNILSSMLPSEKNDSLIIVFIAESDVTFVQDTVNSLNKQFKDDIDSGLVEILAPSSNYYPDMKNIKGTLGDTDERTRWRTKQNLDYAYLMLYAQDKGTFYVQLEDDVLTKKGFITTMKNFALENTMKKHEWFMLDFCQLGFIGKLFRNSDLWRFVDFLLLFYRDKPGDWLLAQFFSVKYCKLDYSHKRCVKELGKYWIHYKPSLFQHIGMISSLNGKVQKLKDRQFGKLELFTKHDNPEAIVESSLKNYGKFSLEKAYNGKNFFWGLAPESLDTITFKFSPPINLKRYRLISGNAEHPSDKIRNATLEVFSETKISNSKAFLRTKDDYFIIDEFDDLGAIDGIFPEFLNPISIVRITIKNASENWIILSEILFEKLN